MANGSDFPIDAHASWSRHTIPLAIWPALALALLATALAIVLVHRQDRIISESHFDELAEKASTTMQGRMDAYQTVLRGSVAFASQQGGRMSREQWREYVDNLELGRFHPGVRGIGYVEVLRPEQAAAHESRARQEGFSEDRVLPPGKQGERAVVLYMEPLDSRNQRVLGQDLLSRPASRAAMERARDSGNPALSHRLTLLSDTSTENSPGFHMFWPVFRDDIAIDTVEARRAALLGYVFAPFRMSDLVPGILGNGPEEANLTIYQGTQPSPEALLYGVHPPVAGAFQVTKGLDIAGTHWLLVFHSTPLFKAPNWKAAEVVALLVFAQILGLLALLQFTNMRARRREGELAAALAHQSTLREERFRLVVEASPNAIIVTNEKGQIELVNRQVEMLFGYSRDELLGQQVEMLIPDNFRAGHPHLRNQFLAAPSARSMGAGRDLFARAKNGKNIPVEIGLNPVHTENGLLVLSSIIDISERKAAEQRFLEQAELIAAASRYKSEFLANMSHELRTPLNSILILSEQLTANAKGNLSPKQVAHAEIINRSGRDLLALINDILDLSKIEAGRMDVQLETIVVAEFAESVEHAFRPMTEAKGLDFYVEVDRHVVEHIQSDHQRIFQIVRNLFSNALKFTSDGSIRICFRNANVADSNSVLAISVIDTGIGIPADRHQMIFNAFQQVDGTTSRRFGGTGLGLTISRQLADLLGGTIEVKSEPGAGSTFTLYLPKRSPEEHVRSTAAPPEALQSVVSVSAGESQSLPSTQTASAAQTRGDHGGQTVLIIESDASLAQLISSTARDFGLTPHVVRNGSEALQVIETAPPAAVILDLRLPDANGWSLLRKLKASPNGRSQQVLVISGPDHPTVVFDGMVGYLVKPVTLSDLERAFAELRMQLQSPLARILLVEDNAVEAEHYARVIGDMGFEVMICVDGKSALQSCREQAFGGLVVDLNLPDMSGFELLDRLKQEDLIQNIGIIVNTGLDLDAEQLQKLRECSVTVLAKSAEGEQRLMEAVSLHLKRLTQPATQESVAPVFGAPQREVPDRAAGVEPVSPPASEEVPVSLAGRRVLVVDDDVRNIYAMCSMLEDMDVAIATATNGVEALEFLESNSDVDLVLMDMMMPIMDGYVATRELKDKRRYGKPIIAVTARAMKGDREKCLEAGADDYLSKPVTNVELRNVLSKWMRRD